MKIQLLNTNIVVIAEGHNPSILHPAFLTGQNIVPKDWKTKGDIICTPPFAKVAYTNGIEFLVQPDRLRITQQIRKDTNLQENPLAELSEKYIKALPHVRYLAVGINFLAICKMEEPTPYLIDNFLKPRPCKLHDRNITGTEVKFSYALGEKGVFHLSLKAAEFVDPEGKKSVGVLTDGNYHHPLDPTSALSDAMKAFSKYERYIDDYLDSLKELFEGWNHD